MLNMLNMAFERTLKASVNTINHNSYLYLNQKYNRPIDTNI